jgi:hypothetical protein
MKKIKPGDIVTTNKNYPGIKILCMILTRLHNNYWEILILPNMKFGYLFSHEMKCMCKQK